MAHTHSHEGCGCSHDHEHDHEHSLSLGRRWLFSVLMVGLLLFFLRPFIIEQLLVRQTSYAGNSSYIEAIRICKKILFLDKNNIQAWTSLGYDYMDLSEPEMAITAFEKVLELNPQDRGAASFELGQAYFAMGAYAKAIACFERIHSTGPKASTVLEADILKYRHGTLGFRSLNSMGVLLQNLSIAYEKTGDVLQADAVQKEYEYYKAHQSKVLF